MRGINIRPSGRFVAAVALALMSVACKKREVGGELGEESNVEAIPAQVMSQLPTIAAALIGPIFVFWGYWFLVFWDRREDRPAKDDKQLGSKLVLWALILSGIAGLLMGADQLIAFVFSGFKGGFGAIKGALAAIVTGAVVVGGLGLMFLPRTNNTAQPQIERYAMGLLGLITGVVTVGALGELISSIFFARGWRTDIAPNLSHLAVFGAMAGFAMLRHGKLSGWTEPVRPVMPSSPAGFPPGQAGGGYPPQGGGYPPQGGGYPPQGGGYGR